MDRLSTDPRFAKVVVFRVDFDTNKELLRQWSGVEKKRSTGDVDPAAIEKIFAASL